MNRLALFGAAFTCALFLMTAGCSKKEVASTGAPAAASASPATSTPAAAPAGAPGNSPNAGSAIMANPNLSPAQQQAELSKLYQQGHTQGNTQ